MKTLICLALASFYWLAPSSAQTCYCDQLGYVPSKEILEELHLELQQKLRIIVIAMSKTAENIALIQDFNECNSSMENSAGIHVLRYNPCFALLVRRDIGKHADSFWLPHEVVHSGHSDYGYSHTDTLFNWGLELEADSIAGGIMEILGIPLNYGLGFQKKFGGKYGALTHPPYRLRMAKTAEAYYLELAKRWRAELGTPLQKMDMNEPAYVSAFIYSNTSVAVKLFFEYGIPPSISLAMQAKSSAYGRSEKKYSSLVHPALADAGWDTYSARLLSQPDIRLLVQNKNYNYLDWGQKVSGLFTDPDYAQDLILQIKRLGLHSLDSLVIEHARNIQKH